MTKIIKNNIFYFLIIFYLLIDYKFFENVYKILFNNYEKRLTNLYGYCEKESYGFVKKNFNRDISKTDFKLINKNKNFPSIRGLFYDFSENTYKNEYIFLLNENDQEKIKIKYKNFKIIKQEGNCFLLKKYE